MGLRARPAFGARGLDGYRGDPDTLPDLPETAPYKQKMVDATLLKRAATLDDVGRVAAFLASEHAGSITSTQVNISCGALVD